MMLRTLAFNTVGSDNLVKIGHSYVLDEVGQRTLLEALAAYDRRDAALSERPALAVADTGGPSLASA